MNEEEVPTPDPLGPIRYLARTKGCVYEVSSHAGVLHARAARYDKVAQTWRVFATPPDRGEPYAIVHYDGAICWWDAARQCWTIATIESDPGALEMAD